MRILLVHNYYQHRSGEEVVFDAEAKLLEARGHIVTRFTRHNDAVGGMGRLALACATVWNRAAYQEIRVLLRQKRPDIVHFHNTLPLISPAAYYATRAEGVPVVQTLHNYRLVCPNALLFRDGHVCEDCMGKFVPWPGVVHACYRNSRVASGAIATMLSVHRGMRTWTRMVNVYVALSEFAREKFIRGGLPTEKVVVKPNFVDLDPGVGERKGGYALYVGRLSPEKGLDTLLAAWQRVAGKVPLKIVGDGPLADRVASAAREIGDVQWLGQQSRDKVLALMRNAFALIVPSVWYETFALVVAEAYAVGLPVIASRLGAWRRRSRTE